MKKKPTFSCSMCNRPLHTSSRVGWYEELLSLIGKGTYRCHNCHRRTHLWRRDGQSIEEAAGQGAPTP